MAGQACRQLGRQWAPVQRARHLRSPGAWMPPSTTCGQMRMPLLRPWNCRTHLASSRLLVQVAQPGLAGPASTVPGLSRPAWQGSSLASALPASLALTLPRRPSSWLTSPWPGWVAPFQLAGQAQVHHHSLTGSSLSCPCSKQGSTAVSMLLDELAPQHQGLLGSPWCMSLVTSTRLNHGQTHVPAGSQVRTPQA